MDVEKPETAIPVSTVYIANERACSSHQLRNRNRSQDSPTSSCVQLAKDFVAVRRKIGDIDIGYEQLSHSTPKGGQNYDCNMDGSRLEGLTPEDSGYLSKGRSFVSSFLSDSLVFPFQKERSRLFDVGESNSNSRPNLRPHNWLPFVLLFVVLASAIVAVCTLNSALHKSGERASNGKYRSIEFGHAQRMKREADTEAPNVEKILEVDGDLLGGKGSAVQPGTELNSNEVAVEGEEVAFVQDPGSEALEEDSFLDDVEIFDSLEFIKELQDYAASKLEEKKKQELLKKIGSFGHFATSVAQSKEKAEGSKKKPKRRSPKSPNDRSNPFRFFKSQMSKPSKDLPNVPKDYDDPSGFR